MNICDTPSGLCFATSTSQSVLPALKTLARSRASHPDYSSYLTKPWYLLKSLYSPYALQNVQCDENAKTRCRLPYAHLTRVQQLAINTWSQGLETARALTRAHTLSRDIFPTHSCLWDTSVEAARRHKIGSRIQHCGKLETPQETNR